MQLVLKQKIYYSNKEWVPVKEIAAALLAYEDTLQLSPRVLEKLFPGTKIDEVAVFLEELRSDSIWEEIIVRFTFGDQQKMEEFIDKAREKLNMESLSGKGQAFLAVVLALLTVGSCHYFPPGGGSSDKATIEANNNVIINIGAQELDMTGQELVELVSSVVTAKDKDRLGANASRFVKPAKRDPEATITFNDDPQLRIEAETIRAIPNERDEPEIEETIEEFKDVLIVIRAVDLDSHKRGWWAVIPDIGDRRIRMQLDPVVDPDHVMQHPKLRGDILVNFEKDGEAKTPKLVFLRKVTSPAQPSLEEQTEIGNEPDSPE